MADPEGIQMTLRELQAKMVAVEVKAATVERESAELKLELARQKSTAIGHADLAELKEQQEDARKQLRANELKLEENKHSSPHNKRMIKHFMKGQWLCADIEENFGKIIREMPEMVEGELPVNPVNAGNLVETGKAVLITLAQLKTFESYLKEERTLVEAASNSAYGWKAAINMEEEKGYFKEDDSANMARLRKAEAEVRRDSKAEKSSGMRGGRARVLKRPGAWSGPGSRWGPMALTQPFFGGGGYRGTGGGYRGGFTQPPGRVPGQLAIGYQGPGFQGPGGGGMAGVCFKCQKPGHKQAQCKG